MYINIQDTVFTDLRLSGNEAIIYALIASFCEHSEGGEYECRLDDIAKRVNLPYHAVQRVLSYLTDSSYLAKKRKQKTVVFTLSDGWRANASPPGSAPQSVSVPSGTAAGQEEQPSAPPPPATVPSDSVAESVAHPALVGSPPPPPEPSLQDVFLECFIAHWNKTHRKEYQHTGGTITTALYNITEMIRGAIIDDDWSPDIGTARTYIPQWLDFAWQHTDQWHHDRWSVEFIASQFNYFNQKAHAPIQQPAAPPAQQQRGGTFSDDYVAAQLAKISGQ